MRYFQDGRWLSWKVSSNKEEEKLRKMDIPNDIYITLDEDADISSYFENVLSEDDYNVESETFDKTDSFEEEDFKVVKAVVKSTEMDKKIRRYNTAF